MRFVLSFFIGLSFIGFCVSLKGAGQKSENYAFFSLIEACENSDDLYLKRRASLTRKALGPIINDFSTGQLSKRRCFGASILGILDYKKFDPVTDYSSISSLDFYVLSKVQRHLTILHSDIASRMRVERTKMSAQRLFRWQEGVIQMHLLIDDIQRLQGNESNRLLSFNVQDARNDRLNNKKILFP